MRTSCLLLVFGLIAYQPAFTQITHNVQVQNNVFSPATLTIDPGDSVRFRNVGGGLHNVRADDDSFRCANGCDGQGGNGTPSTSTWDVTITFNTPGDIPYYCEIHGAPGGLGMAGVITVSNTLSVEMTSFRGFADGAAIELRWETAQEEDNAGFRIEHRTENSAYEIEGFQVGAGSSDVPHAYRHRVEGIESGRHFFRLQQVDFDGRTTTGREISVELTVTGPSALSAPFPNPFADRARVRLTLTTRQFASVRVFDLLGRHVATLSEGTLEAGPHDFTFDAADLPTGTYFIRAVGDSFTHERSVIHTSR